MCVTRVCVFVCVYLCVHACVHACVYLCVYVCVRLRARVYLCVCVRVCVCVTAKPSLTSCFYISENVLLSKFLGHKRFPHRYSLLIIV